MEFLHRVSNDVDRVCRRTAPVQGSQSSLHYFPDDDSTSSLTPSLKGISRRAVGRRLTPSRMPPALSSLTFRLTRPPRELILMLVRRFNYDCQGHARFSSWDRMYACSYMGGLKNTSFVYNPFRSSEACFE